MTEPDGVDEVVAGGLRVAVTAAGLVAERIAQARVEQARQARAASAAETRRLEAQYSAELAAARGQLSLVERDGWWKAATVNDVADAWEIAQAWRGVDPDVDQAAERIRNEVRDRYGIYVDELRDGDVDRGALERAVAEREGAAAARQRAREAAEQLEAAVVVAADAAAQERDSEAAQAVEDIVDGRGAAEVPTARQPSEQSQEVAAAVRGGAERDVTGRRAGLADALSQIDDHEAVEARLLADVSDGRPAREAVTKPPRSAPKARKTRSTAPQVRQRGMGR